MGFRSQISNPETEDVKPLADDYVDESLAAQLLSAAPVSDEFSGGDNADSVEKHDHTSYFLDSKEIITESVGSGASGGRSGTGPSATNLRPPSLFPSGLFCIFTSFGFYMNGFALGFTGPTLTAIEEEFHWKDPQSSLFSSIVCFGAMGGAFLGGSLGERFGRRTSLVISAIPFVIGWVTMITSSLHTAWMMHLSRLILGLGIGMTTLLVPVYVGEVAPTKIRGILGSVNQLSGVVGVFVVYCLGLPIRKWRYFGYVGIAQIVVWAIAMACAAESHLWLLKRGKTDRARAALHRLRGGWNEAVQIEFDAAIADVKFSLSQGSYNRKNVSIMQRLKGLMAPRVRRPLVLAFMLQVLQQLNGINAVIFFCGQIFASAGISNPNLASVAIGAVQMIATALFTTISDKFGRRPLLTISSGGMAICLVVLGWAFHSLSKGPTYGWLAVGSLITFIIFFSVAAGNIPWVMLGEIFPADVRGFGSGFTVLICWLFVFLVTNTFKPLADAVTVAGVYWIYAGFSLMSAFYAWFFVLETKGRTLAEIETMFSSTKEHSRSAPPKADEVDGNSTL